MSKRKVSGFLVFDERTGILHHSSELRRHRNGALWQYTIPAPKKAAKRRVR